MLSEREELVWQDVQRRWSAEIEDPAPPGSGAPGGSPDRPGLEDMPAAAVAGVWVTILLLLVGAVWTGLTVGAVTALAWWLLRNRTTSDRTTALPDRAPHPGRSPDGSRR